MLLIDIIYQTVDSSTPYTATLTFAALEYATTLFAALRTTPVLSRTPYPAISASYSIYSAASGVPDAARATLTKMGVALILTTLIFAYATVSAGVVYTVVLVVALELVAPGLQKLHVTFSFLRSRRFILYLFIQRGGINHPRTGIRCRLPRRYNP